jgi:hypothetical protein
MDHIKDSCQNIVDEYQRMFEQFQITLSENVRLKKENLKLIENEKDLMSVSSIVATKNENASLLQTIATLEKSNSKLRTNIQTLQTIINTCNSTSVASSHLLHEGASIQEKENDCFDVNNANVHSEEIQEEEIYTVTHKKVSYYLDAHNQLYEIGSDGEKLKKIGKRKFDEKKGKYKYVFDKS